MSDDFAYLVEYEEALRESGEYNNEEINKMVLDAVK